MAKKTKDIQSILDEAMEKASTEKRASYLDRAGEHQQASSRLTDRVTLLGKQGRTRALTLRTRGQVFE